MGYKLKDMAGKEYDLAQLKNNKGSVIIFLSPECPLCQKYSLTFNKLQKDYEAKGIKFYGIIPGTNYSAAVVNGYAKKYKVSMPLLADATYGFTKDMGATVTPQVMLFNSTGAKIYSGKIDNWYETIAKRRTVITEHYLKDAMDTLLKGETVKTKVTTPVGCFIF